MSRPSRSVHSLLLLLLLFLAVLAQAKRQPGQEKPDKPRPSAPSTPPPPPPPPPSKRPRNRSVPGSGELTTKEGHRCTWQTSGEALVTLLVNCSAEGAGQTHRYWCRYAGKPDLCQAYGVKSSQYWKQLVGKLKKRQQACDGEKVLKAKTCKKAPAEAHMKLAQRGGGGGGGGEDEERRGGGGGGRKKGVTAGKSGADGGKRKKKEEEQEEEEEEKKRLEDRRTGFEEDEEGVVNDMAPAQTYCGEGWHSVCSFFVKFFEG